MTMDYIHTHEEELPSHDLDTARMPGHWLLARLGKRVLRPGGIELTRELLAALGIGPDDDVIEFAPGLGVTARLTLARGPRSYRAVERDPRAARLLRHSFEGHGAEFHTGSADNTGLPDESATVLYGEAMLSMQTERQKERIVAEAARLLRPGGRYGIHELCLQPDDLPDDVKDAIRRDMSAAVHVGVRPLTVAEWTHLLEENGLEPMPPILAPFRLLEPTRIVRDEGLPGAIRFASRVLRDGAARRRVLQMRGTFKRHRQYLSAVAFVARKK